MAAVYLPEQKSSAVCEEVLKMESARIKKTILIPLYMSFERFTITFMKHTTCTRITSWMLSIKLINCQISDISLCHKCQLLKM